MLLFFDPFSGTATTGLVAAQQGLSAHCFDINPFLIWLGNAKCRNYSDNELKKLNTGINLALIECQEGLKKENWLPKIHNITRWWNEETLTVLAALRQALVNHFGEPKADESSALAWIGFCRLIIETSSAAFNHVSMSFHDQTKNYEIKQIAFLYLKIVNAIAQSACERIVGKAKVYLVDCREPVLNNEVKYSHIITSPPYPNRISYIRELRPYMYWTKFLDTASEAGELDWKTIGGTWGIATSRLENWESNRVEIPDSLKRVILKILATEEKHALLMANYVWKYFHDMYLHLQNLRDILKKGAVLSYIVGNSNFYKVPVQTDKLLEEALKSLGFSNIGSQVIRKRNSQKQLFEYCVYATWQGTRKYEPMFSNESKQMPLF
jgi:DNA modification methylase